MARLGFTGDQIVSVSEEHSGRVLVIAAKVPAGQDDCATDLSATLIGWVPNRGPDAKQRPLKDDS